MDEQQEYIPNDPVGELTDAYLHRDVHPDEKGHHAQSSVRDTILHHKHGHDTQAGVEDSSEYWKYC